MRVEFKEKENKIERGCLLEVDGDIRGVVMNITKTSSGKYGRLFDIEDFSVAYFVIVIGEVLLFDKDPFFPKNHNDISQKVGFRQHDRLEEEYDLHLQSDEFHFIPTSDYKLVVGE